MKRMEKHRQRVQKLNDKGFECLNAHDFDKAIKIGKRLRALRYSSAFEILGLAYAKQDKLKKAIRVLEEGVEKVPAVWLLWQLLGNYYSDRGKYKKALQAYQNALGCPSVDEGSVEYNIAIVLQRRNRLNDALEYVDRALSHESDNVKLELTALALKVSLLGTMNRSEESAELADEVLGREASYKGRAEDAAEMSVVQTKLADIRWKGKHDKSAALKSLWQAVAHDKWNQEAVDAVRRLMDKKSQKAKYFRVLIEGVWNEPADALPTPGFFIDYDVIADDPTEAMKFLKRFEPPQLRRSLIMRECEPLADWPDEPKGVYKTFPYRIFPRDNEEDGNHDN